MIQNKPIDLKVTICDTRDHKYSRRDFYTVFWKNGRGPETICRVFKKRMTKKFAIRSYDWLEKMYEGSEEQAGWREYLRNTVIKEYEPV